MYDGYKQVINIIFIHNVFSNEQHTAKYNTKITRVFLRVRPRHDGEGIMLSDCPSALFVRPFARTDLVTKISHEWLE